MYPNTYRCIIRPEHITIKTGIYKYKDNKSTTNGKQLFNLISMYVFMFE